MNLSQVHLLLADDDVDEHALFEDALREIPVSTQLTTVKDGRELMNWLTEKKESLPDLLFLDLNMPIKKGWECLGEIKQHPTLHDLPVIIYSTATVPREVVKLHQLGAQCYVQKPTNFSDLVNVIEQVLALSEDQLRIQPSLDKFILNPK